MPGISITFRPYGTMNWTFVKALAIGTSSQTVQETS